MDRHRGEGPLWLRAARAGSADALGRALEACRGYLLQIARRELGPDLQAKCGASDLVQQTFLEANRDFSYFHGATENEWRARLRAAARDHPPHPRPGHRGTANGGGPPAGPLGPGPGAPGGAPRGAPPRPRA